MSAGAADPISFFCSQLSHRRFGGETLQLLESLLVSRDVASLLRTRSILQGILRTEGGPALREAEGRGTDGKLLVAEFFLKAFALVGDVESCLALKYEALILRELRSASDPSLRVSHEEWLTFATDSFDHEFHNIAIKGFDNALRCIQSDSSYRNLEAVTAVRERRDKVLKLVCSHSVQAQAAEYMREKHALKEQESCQFVNCVASSVFRKGIKTRNLLNLQRSRARHTNLLGSDKGLAHEDKHWWGLKDLMDYTTWMLNLIVIMLLVHLGYSTARAFTVNVELTCHLAPNFARSITHLAWYGIRWQQHTAYISSLNPSPTSVPYSYSYVNIGQIYPDNEFGSWAPN